MPRKVATGVAVPSLPPSCFVSLHCHHYSVLQLNTPQPSICLFSSIFLCLLLSHLFIHLLSDRPHLPSSTFTCLITIGIIVAATHLSFAPQGGYPTNARLLPNSHPTLLGRTYSEPPPYLLYLAHIRPSSSISIQHRYHA